MANQVNYRRPMVKRNKHRNDHFQCYGYYQVHRPEVAWEPEFWLEVYQELKELLDMLHEEPCF